ncbi:hypothetical protein [Pseudomonas brassicacearum]|uniref:hypothetical protein n=1 Tax=Pseudomonas brassicacearum TaxID=930166 RepID=UPI001295AC13|nr:hypothetical protein [Pseudomonas brassicacearum]QGA51833.1 hypothetical protein GFU70_22865 [Pseudomonas brassicacearum]
MIFLRLNRLNEKPAEWIGGFFIGGEFWVYIRFLRNGGLWFCVGHEFCVHWRLSVGAKLARDGGIAVDEDIECAGLFAGKPAPTVVLCWT